MAFFKKEKVIEVKEPEEFDIKIKLTNIGGCCRKEISINGGPFEIVNGFSVECMGTNTLPTIKTEQWV